MMTRLMQNGRLILKDDKLIAILCSPSEGEPASTDHLDWPEAMMNGERMVEADSCLQLCQSLFGDEWRVMIKALVLLSAYSDDKVTFGAMCAALNTPDNDYITVAKLDDIRQKAIAAGVKLARGEE